MSRLSSSTPDFDPLARLYRWMEFFSFGPMLARCRFSFLERCRLAHRALLLGDGDGRFAGRLITENPDMAVDAVDASGVMLAELRRRVEAKNPGAVARLRTVQTDIRTFTPDRSGYDLVVTHFFLDCLDEDEIDTLAARLIPHLSASANWVVSEFAIPNRGLRRYTARGVIGFLYFAFHLLTRLRIRWLPNYAPILERHGFTCAERVSFLGGLLIAEHWQRQPATRHEAVL